MGSKNQSFVQLVFPTSPTCNSFVQHRGCDFETLFEQASPTDDVKICSSFSNHGHCVSGKKCPLSHDIDLVVLNKDVDTVKNDRKRKRSPPEKRKNSDQEDKKSNEDLPI